MDASITYGLLGQRLGHSWSPKIHTLLGSMPYDLIELEEHEVEGFVRTGSWRGLNVTIPYKRLAFELADGHSERARRLGVANTLVKRSDGSVWADNTDLAGFSWMLERFCTRKLGETSRKLLEGRKALVLGSGGASKAVQAALEDQGARVVIISRSGDETYHTLAQRHADATLLVNTTPVGMFPTCPDTPVDIATLAQLKSLRGVLDIVYNPSITGICLAAEKLGLPFETGLAMLVAQARFSAEAFLEHDLDDELLEAITGELLRAQKNIVFIGMPGAGKTTTGRSLARLIKRPFIDLDEAVNLETGMPAADYINAYGEEAFRTVETKVCSAYGAGSGTVIACGGGVVTRQENYALLHQNATIVLLDRPLEELSTKGRPVSQSRGIEALAREREPLYEAWSDLRVPCTGSAQGDALHTKKLLGL